MADRSGLNNKDLNRLGAAAEMVAAALDCSVADAVGWIENAAAELGEQDHTLEHFATRLLKVRLTRNEVLGAPLFQDLAWNMLLDLFINEGEGRSVSISSLTIASGGAQTTALRYLDKLLAHGLVTRADDRSDGRRSWISLTADTKAAIASLLSQVQEQC